jgi:hypothetical protein
MSPGQDVSAAMMLARERNFTRASATSDFPN